MSLPIVFLKFTQIQNLLDMQPHQQENHYNLLSYIWKLESV